jgi:glucosylceramidase
VAFKTPTGKNVLIVLNDGTLAANFNIKQAGKWAVAQVPANAVVTFVW